MLVPTNLADIARGVLEEDIDHELTVLAVKGGGRKARSLIDHDGQDKRHKSLVGRRFELGLAELQSG